MNEKCKYCDYVSKCSRKCEYDSIMCKVYRSFSKVVDKSYEQLQQENKILRENAEHNDKVVDKVNWENMLLKKENKQLKDNWNKLRDYVLKKQAILFDTEYACYSNVLDKMKQLEENKNE